MVKWTKKELQQASKDLAIRRKSMNLNPEHIKKINALIPLAEKEARQKLKTKQNKTESRIGAYGKLYDHYFYSEFFHNAMNRLAIKAGLRMMVLTEQKLRIKVLENRIKWHQEEIDSAEEEIRGIEEDDS